MTSEPRPIVLVCEHCGDDFDAARSHARTCSTRCRVALHRQRQTIPGELRRRPRWVRWRNVRRNGKTTKMPVQISGRAASSTDPATWTDYATARDSDVGDGLGFVLDGDGIVCIDLDHCFKGDRLTVWAQRLVDLAGDTYVERSPSGDGLHIWGRAEVDKGRVLRDQRAVEIYGRGRYLTVTGDRYADKPSRLADIDQLVEDVLPRR